MRHNDLTVVPRNKTRIVYISYGYINLHASIFDPDLNANDFAYEMGIITPFNVKATWYIHKITQLKPATQLTYLAAAAAAVDAGIGLDLLTINTYC